MCPLGQEWKSENSIWGYNLEELFPVLTTKFYLASGILFYIYAFAT